MKLYKTSEGIIIENEGKFYAGATPWEEMVNREGLHDHLLRGIEGRTPAGVTEEELLKGKLKLLPPIDHQEVWAAGVTYMRSREARMEESQESGGATFYDKVYYAERPELFFKAMPHRVAGPGEAVYIRPDSSWNVPEPELTLFINSKGHIQGYTVGNDMSSRSIEGENPLYLPQAKVYDRSAALGPCLLVPREPLSPDTVIHLRITRHTATVYDDQVKIGQLKRTFEELAGWLYRACSFPRGCYLMTGTCLVPPDDFTLQEGDQVHITIDGIGTLSNTVSYPR